MNYRCATVTAVFPNNHLIAVLSVVMSPFITVTRFDADADWTRADIHTISVSGHRERYTCHG